MAREACGYRTHVRGPCRAPLSCYGTLFCVVAGMARIYRRAVLSILYLYIREKLQLNIITIKNYNIITQRILGENTLRLNSFGIYCRVFFRGLRERVRTRSSRIWCDRRCKCIVVSRCSSTRLLFLKIYPRPILRAFPIAPFGYR